VGAIPSKPPAPTSRQRLVQASRKRRGELTDEMTDTRLPIILVTGFLGSGKTTVLNHLLRAPQMRSSAVIVNEFGSVGLDHELVSAVSENIVLLDGGCLCCSIRGDLVETLYDLLERRLSGDIAPFDRVVVETTGLADPTPIFHTLMTDQMLAGQFRLQGIVSTIDAAVGLATLDRQPESVKQVALADCVLLTKTDLASLQDITALEERIASLNPAAPIVHVRNGDLEPDVFLDLASFDTVEKDNLVQTWLNADAYGSVHSDAAAINSACLILDRPIPLAILDLWLDALISQQGPDLLRMKGVINVEGKSGPVLIHGVQHIFHPPRDLDEWPSDDHRSRIVLIARNLGKKRLESSLAFLRSTAVSGGTGPLHQASERRRSLPGLGG